MDGGDWIAGVAALLAAVALVVSWKARSDTKRAADAQVLAAEIAERESKRYRSELLSLRQVDRDRDAFVLENLTGEDAIDVQFHPLASTGVTTKPTEFARVGHGDRLAVRIEGTFGAQHQSRDVEMTWRRPTGEEYRRRFTLGY